LSQKVALEGERAPASSHTLAKFLPCVRVSLVFGTLQQPAESEVEVRN
jgi:hypothetical protein